MIYQLKRHDGGICSFCDGTGAKYGVEIEVDGGEPAEKCDACDGTLAAHWEWVGEHDGVCDSCGEESERMSKWGEEGQELICLACVRKAHADGCGCDLWAGREGDDETAGRACA